MASHSSVLAWETPWTPGEPGGLQSIGSYKLDTTERLNTNKQPKGYASGKEPACQCRRCRGRDSIPSLGREDPLKEGMATHSSVPAWRIPWTKEAGRLQSTGLHRVGED